jgi:hypothetical protein
MVMAYKEWFSPLDCARGDSEPAEGSFGADYSIHPDGIILPT